MQTPSGASGGALGKAYGANPISGPAYDLWQGYSGQNQADFGESFLQRGLDETARLRELQARYAQGQFGGILQAQMRGQGPSVAQYQLAQGRDAAERAAMATAASARGSNVALAGRSAAQAAGGAATQSARDAAMLRAQEQLSAQQQYAALLQAQRQQDLAERGQSLQGEIAQLQAGTAYNALAEKAGEANAAGRAKAYGGILSAAGGALTPSDVRAKTDVTPIGGPTAYSQQELTNLSPRQPGLYPADYQNPNPTYDPFATGATMDQIAQQEHAYQWSQPQQQQGGGGGFNIASFLGGLSDPAAKSDLTALSGVLTKAASKVQPYQFRYKPEVAATQGVGTEPRVGVMANGGPGSLESNPVYAPAVSTGPDGLRRVDPAQATLANIAVTSDLAKQVEGLKALVAAKGPPAGARPSGEQFAPTQPAAITNRDYPQQQHLNPGLFQSWDAVNRMGEYSGRGQMPDETKLPVWQNNGRLAPESREGRVAEVDTNRDIGNTSAKRGFGERPRFEKLPPAGRLVQSDRPFSNELQPGETPVTPQGVPAFDLSRAERENYNARARGREEQQLGDAAAGLKQAKTPDERKFQITELARAIRSELDPRSRKQYGGSSVYPKALLEVAKQRGVKNLTEKEVKEALRPEYSL